MSDLPPFEILDTEKVYKIRLEAIAKLLSAMSQRAHTDADGLNIHSAGEITALREVWRSYGKPELR